MSDKMREALADYWSDWLIDAVGGATQNRALLRGDPAEDAVLTEAIVLNGKKAILNALNVLAEATPSRPVTAGREEIAKAIRNALVENWNDAANARSWNEDVLLTGCRKVGGGMGYQKPEEAAQRLALDATDAILALGFRDGRAADIELEARFLLDRLEDLDFGDDAERDFNGHVAPSMSRLRGLVGPTVSPQDGGSPTLGSSIDLLIGLSFKHVETLDPDAKHRHYRECGCCGGTDENRDHYKPDIGKVEHKAGCPLARDLPILRSIGLASDAAHTLPRAEGGVGS